ncbi:MAG: ECF transporter S component [Clostridia bacterium]|nr:ECF transporter S component [Clostridia bacterium]
MNKIKRNEAFKTTILGLMLALIFLFWYGIGTIDLGFISITLSCLPVIIGTMALGLDDGFVLGICFGGVSFFTAMMTPKGLIAPIFAVSPLWVAVLCFVPRILVPIVTNAVMTMVQKRREKKALVLPAVAGSLTNTVFFLGFIVIMYGLLSVDSAAALANIGRADSTLMGLVGMTVLVGGIPEAIVAGLVCPPVIYALKKAHFIDA